MDRLSSPRPRGRVCSTQSLFRSLRKTKSTRRDRSLRLIKRWGYRLGGGRSPQTVNAELAWFVAVHPEGGQRYVRT